ncbi:MAG: Gfo/Idh/MocA family protein, partial [Blastocatellia bacterium]
MSNPTNSRRNFIKRSSAGVVGGLGAWNAASYARILGANDRIGLGIVGCSERAMEALVPALEAISSERNCEIVAVSDIWNLRREEGAGLIGKLTGKPIAKARNNDELYDLKNVQAVIIATPDHQHALHGVEAARAGRDAYIEKPLANTMADARAILKAARETKRVIQIGTQRRSAQNTVLAKEFIQSGEFGAINTVELSTNANQPGRWRRPKLVETLRREDTDWNRYLMGRSKDEWDPHKYIEFRLYWPYSSGIPCQWMVHQIDALHFITGLQRPRSVIAHGGIYQWRDGRINPDTVT